MGFFTRNQKGEDESAGQESRQGQAGAQQSFTRRKSVAGSRDEAAADDLRRRARRRLVGAIAMVLAAVIVLPMILDSEREPLPENVAIQIPSPDAPFQPNLTPAAPSAQPGAAQPGVAQPGAATDGQTPAPPAAPDIRTPASLANVTPLPALEAPPQQPAPVVKPPATPIKPPPPPAPPAAPRTTPPNAAAAQKEAEAARALALLQGKQAPAPRASSAAQPSASRYAVQVVAVRSREGADSLLSTLKGAGLAAYIETIKTPDGQVHRVRLGPFNSKSQAESAQAKLRGLPGGYNGSLVPL